MTQEPTYEELIDFARWTQTFWKNGIEIMRKNGLVIKSDDPMEKLAFTFYSDLCEIDVKAAHLFNEGYGDKNYKDETAIQAQTITAYPKPYEERMRKEAKITELQDFDRWFSGRHVCGQSPIIPEVRQELHRRIDELRKGEP